MKILAIVLSVILFGLAVIHFNWALGGRWGFDNALPTTQSGERVFNPKKLDSGIVGLGLSAFALFYLLRLDIIHLNIPDWVFTYGGWIIPFIFIMRAIGEFRYVGFFKKIRDTTFGQLDTKYYSPLCLLIGLVGLIIQIMK